ncbi:hypothetical protein BUALT_Bualt12G0022600 [Buddleja alternifolia]|uniref:Alpha-carbonic anhydrase domain-containing protein n=1 Tax=Buddleja alternifolia TaxID=168488 RepID=A0AAV6WMT0_9LAMI|nr:hypothetical protein BUALT_Bualt12G0022600 [Buddleja alternifolia]
MALKNNNFTLILFDCLLLASLLFTVNANEPEVEDESSFSYVVGAPDGPQNWGNLNPNWTLCGTGTMQSPINIFTLRVVAWPSLGELNKTYKPAPALIKNRGHDIEVEWTGDAGGIIINGTEYKLEQCHWHIPAEHTVNGLRSNMELHIVHSNAQGDIAVVAILYRLGNPDPFLASISPFLQSATLEGTDIGVVNPSNITFPGRDYYRYIGSLTTPPCSENVTWTVFKMVGTVSLGQIRALRDAVHDGSTGNARPIQPLNGRTVYLYRPRAF